MTQIHTYLNAYINILKPRVVLPIYDELKVYTQPNSYHRLFCLLVFSSSRNCLCYFLLCEQHVFSSTIYISEILMFL